MTNTPRACYLLWSLTLCAALMGSVLLISARDDNAATFDESHHLATGLEYVQYGTYRWWTENPPLGRIAVAALPYLDGLRLPAPEVWDPSIDESSSPWEVGLELLYSGEGYEHNLRRARLGTFPFYLLTLFATWLLARGRRSPLAGLVAVGLAATTPSLLAHGALATTDMASAATVLFTMVAWRHYLEHPRLRNGALVGLSCAVAMFAKFSALAFVPALMSAVLIGHWLHGTTLKRFRASGARPVRLLAQHAALAVGVGILALWAGFGFSVGAIESFVQGSKEWQIYPSAEARTGFEHWLYSTPLPAPEVLHGLLSLKVHQANGHPAFLLGRSSEFGFWYFYPVLLWFKTPLVLLSTGLLSLGWAVRALVQRARGAACQGEATTTLVMAVAGVLGSLAVVAPSHVNIGSRHVLLVFPLLCVAVGSGIAALSQRRSTPRLHALVPALAGALVLAQFFVAWQDRNRLIASFNWMAGDDPSQIASDSDLDWGQDLLRLGRYLQENNIQSVKLAYFGANNACKHGIPGLQPLPTSGPTTGWIAISEFYTRGSTFLLRPDPCDISNWWGDYKGPKEPFAWLSKHEPVARLASMRIYHIVE